MIHVLIKLAPTGIISCSLKEEVSYVVDFGDIILKFNWPKHTKHSTLIESYIKFILESFCADTIIIVDGYPDEFTEDLCNRKRRCFQTTLKTNNSPSTWQEMPLKKLA